MIFPQFRAPGSSRGHQDTAWGPPGAQILDFLQSDLALREAPKGPKQGRRSPQRGVFQKIRVFSYFCQNGRKLPQDAPRGPTYPIIAPCFPKPGPKLRILRIEIGLFWTRLRARPGQNGGIGEASGGEKEGGTKQERSSHLNVSHASYPSRREERADSNAPRIPPDPVGMPRSTVQSVGAP